MTQNYGKEIAQLKGKVTQQDAQIILSDKVSLPSQFGIAVILSIVNAISNFRNLRFITKQEYL